MLFACALAGCNGPVNAAGSYSVALTDKTNACALSGWTEGSMLTNIGVTLTQQDDNVTAIVNGVAGASLVLSIGSSTFTGKVNGQSLDLMVYGTRQATTDACTYTFNAELDATLIGDLLSGTIHYRPATAGTCDAAFKSCSNDQDFNGTRPPT